MARAFQVNGVRLESGSRGRGKGFTLIELVATIVILGALAALALPQLVDLRSSAHEAAVDGVADAFGTAVRFAFTKCVLGNWAGQDDLPGFGAGDVDFNSACFPSDTGGSNDVGNNNNRCVGVWNGILAAGPTASTAPNADYRASASGGVCTFAYQLDPSATREFTYDSQTGAVVVTSNP